jgi:transposase-like protein
MPRVTGKNLKQIIRENVDKDATIMTDSFIGYRGLKKEFAGHEMVDHHREEYVRGNAYTNTVENYFSLLKRGIIGTYHHVSKHHLHRYLAEFDFRYNSRKVEDAARSMLAVKGIEGKRLIYAQ